MADAGQYRCPWCGQAADPGQTNCRACGSPVDVRLSTSKGGWSELPKMRDMARIQFGQSHCQIEGTYVPVADFNLAAGDGVYFAHHLLLWKEESVQVTAMSMAKAWKRLFSGLPLVMTQAHGPGRVAFSKDAPGEMIALPLDVGHGIDVREHVFLVATHSVSYDWTQSGIWFQTGSGNDTELHYPLGMFMDQFTATTAPGLLLLHGAGNVFVRSLQENETILVKPTSLLFKDRTVRMHLHVEHPGGTWQTWRSWGQRYMWLRLRGPGRVAVQSNYEPMEDPGGNLTDCEPMTTRHQW